MKINSQFDETLALRIGPPRLGSAETLRSSTWWCVGAGMRCAPFLLMTQDTNLFDRFFALAAEVERVIAYSVVSEHVRDACAIVRGHLDLVRLHGEPINVDELERVLARIASEVGDAKFRRRFLTQLRVAAAWSRLAPM